MIQAEHRIALVIGNSQYKTMPLKNPENDATDIANKLKKYGFKVSKVINGSRKQIKAALRRFSRDLSQEKTIGLFYYAGHGVQIKGQNYLIPVDAEIKSEFEVEDEAIPINRVLNAMEQAGNNLNLVILDACRDNPFARSFRSQSRGLARMGAPKGSMIFYATSPGDVASEGKGRNGVFTKNLLASMDTPNLTVEQVFKRTALLVSKETGKKQVPWVEGLILGEFYFKVTVEKVPKSTFDQIPATSEVISTKNNKNESLFWSSVKDSQDPAELQVFLSSFPNGEFAPLARIRLKKLSAAKSISSKIEPSMTSQNKKQSNAEIYQLTIRSNVYQDTVFINGKEYGSTKLQLQLPQGRYKVVISKEGYQDFTKTLYLQENATIRGYLSRQENNMVYNRPTPTQNPNSIVEQYNAKVEIKKVVHKKPFINSGVDDEIFNGYSIQEALKSGIQKQILNRRIKLYFGSQHAPIIKRMKKVTINKKTNAFGKSAQVSCSWAFLGALKALQRQARKNGANAIVNIKSVYKRNVVSNRKQFQCDKGAFVSRVSLTGRLARVR